MRKLSKRHFWEWFKRHHQEYLELDKKSKKEAAYWLNELNAHVRAYFKFLEFTLMWPEEKSASLCITVNGKAAHFDKVDKFVSIAPDLPNWKITALEGPMAVDFLLDKEIENAGVHPEEFFFSFASDHSNDGDLIVYHPLCTKQNERLLSQLAYAAVYNLLGERSFGMDIGFLEVANLSAASSKDIKKLEELPAIIGSRRSSIVVDGNGRLLSKD